MGLFDWFKKEKTKDKQLNDELIKKLESLKNNVDNFDREYL